MIGIDLGLNVGSVTVVNSEGELVTQEVLNLKKRVVRASDDWTRICQVAQVYADLVWGVSPNLGATDVTIEEPIYSWGRRNPKVFAKSVMLFTLVRLHLSSDFSVRTVNNTTAKRIAGSGSYKKPQMIAAFKKKVKYLDPKRYKSSFSEQPKYAQETLADSYFIALAGLRGGK